MATAQDLIDEFQADSTFDADDTQVLRWLNRRHQKMVARSRCLKQTIEVATTTAGTAFYPLDVIEAYYFEVDGVPCGRARHPDRYANSQGALVWSGAGVLVIADADEDGVRGVTLVPTPTETGKSINAYVAGHAPVLEAGDALVIDDEEVDALLAGMWASAYTRLEDRPDMAASAEAVFDAGCEELRRRVMRRFRGSGPPQIRVQGINA